MKTRQVVSIVLVLMLLGTLLSACGPSAETIYAEKTTISINNFSTQFTEFSNAISSGKIDDPAWQTQVSTVMDKLDQAAGALGGVPAAEVPETLKPLDGYCKEIANETPVMTKAVRDAFKEYNAGNREVAITKLSAASASAEKLSAVATKANAEIEKLSK